MTNRFTTLQMALLAATSTFRQMTQADLNGFGGAAPGTLIADFDPDAATVNPILAGAPACQILKNPADSEYGDSYSFIGFDEEACELWQQDLGQTAVI